MRRAPSNSARTVAFAAAFCALSIASGCGRETFDLLPDLALAVAGSGLSAGAGSDLGGGGLAGLAGFAGSTAGLGGAKAGAGGAGGRPGAFPGGGPGNYPCLGEAGCADEGPYCPTQCGFGEVCNPYTQRCAQRCKENDDCANDKEHLRCLSELGICVTCIWDGDCANFGAFNDHCFLNACAQCSKNEHCPNLQTCVGGHCIKR